MADDPTEELCASESKFRLITESAFDAIITIDRDSKIVSWNRGAERMFGYAADEVIGGPLHIIIPEKYRKRHGAGIRRLNQTGESHVIGSMSEMEGIRKDGRAIPIELSVSSWMIDGQPYYSGIIRDISRRREFELRRKEQMRHRTELERHQSLSYMVVGIAHELNTPLGVIWEAATVLADTAGGVKAGKLPAEALASTDLLDAAHLIAANAERAMNLVESFKKLSVHQRVDQKEEVDLVELIQDAIGLYRLQADSSKLHIEIHEALGEDRRIWYGYPTYFTQIISSLLSNAEHWAYPEGHGGRVEITVEWVDDDKRYKLTVTDYGLGISKEDMKHIFTPFFTTGRAQGYMGLGLAIVYNLVFSALKGTIRVQSRHGIGTRVVLELPARVEGTEDVSAGMLF